MKRDTYEPSQKVETFCSNHVM